MFLQAKSATSATAAAKKELSDMAAQLSAAKKEAADAHKAAEKAEAKLKDNDSNQHQVSAAHVLWFCFRVMCLMATMLIVVQAWPHLKFRIQRACVYPQMCRVDAAQNSM